MAAPTVSPTLNPASSTAAEAGYNERLFGDGVRGFLHLSRFRWVARQLSFLAPAPRSIVELGCFDGKILRFLPIVPARYLGFDANWEGGLDLANAAWRRHPEFEFKLCTAPEHFALGGEKFDVGLCMETLEHLPAGQVGAYLEALASSVTGKLLISVPNETGMVFLAKFLAKRVSGRSKGYTARDVAWLTLGRTDKVARNEHKGFSWRALAQEISKHFEIEKIEGLPLQWLPPSLNFTVGIVARPKGRA